LLNAGTAILRAINARGRHYFQFEECVCLERKKLEKKKKKEEIFNHL